jgi:hypothetical protein
MCYFLQFKSVEKTHMRHGTVMQLLVKRFVTTEQQRREEEYGITEDDVMEIRQDISTMRYELVDILRKNGMKTPDVSQGDSCTIVFLLVFDRILSEGWNLKCTYLNIYLQLTH